MVFLATIQNSPNVEFVDFDYESAMQLRELKAIPEMHDRMIVATAVYIRQRLLPSTNQLLHLD